MTDETKPADPVLEALRKVWTKLTEIEMKVEAVYGALQRQGTLNVNGGRKRTNPQFLLLRGRLEAEFLKVRGARYTFDARDGKAVANLLKRGLSVDAVVERWRRALGDPQLSSIFSFDYAFNKYAPTRGERETVTSGQDVYAGGKP